MQTKLQKRAWFHNGLRGRVTRGRRSLTQLLNSVVNSDTTTARAKKLAREIDDKFIELEWEIKNRVDP
jgi:hypothetical protein|tara:strand:- start:28758 stop:28961 length:204 start_codon:yes stop_codon:yes gene_type:complete